MGHEMLTVVDVARELGLSEQTIRKWIRKKYIPYIRLGRQLRIKMSTLASIQENGIHLVSNQLQDTGDKPEYEWEKFKEERELKQHLDEVINCDDPSKLSTKNDWVHPELEAEYGKIGTYDPPMRYDDEEMKEPELPKEPVVGEATATKNDPNKVREASSRQYSEDIANKMQYLQNPIVPDDDPS